ncbi:YciI family protein [Sedimentitalea sp. JM2-8]|uniref:YciI family protein n=1 Tax=Sedimentitalea xiamensis TaxID=3050037 RepID=A0ABT7FHN6_9RHOB|nr:YciI family protein [Sedimentitalea xiamensis]MDK3074651.1 YciI family protein [Sedimentitalea xiamensis]
MKYLCLVYLDRENWSSCPDAVCADYVQHLVENGNFVAGDPLHPVESATTVRVRNGKTQLYDGPFAETKELLAGYYMLDARDLNDALRLAAGIPPAKYGSIEVRPVRQLDLGDTISDSQS